MKLLGKNKSKITRNENAENVSQIVILLMIIINKFKEFCIHLFLINNFHSKIDSELSCSEAWFTDQNSKPLNITLVIN